MRSTRKSPDLSAEEEFNVRAALRFLHFQCGGWKPLSKPLRYSHSALSKVMGGGRAVTANLVFRIAKLAKIGVDDILSGRYPPPGTCPNCGYCRSEALQ